MEIGKREMRWWKCKSTRRMQGNGWWKKGIAYGALLETSGAALRGLPLLKELSSFPIPCTMFPNPPTSPSLCGLHFLSLFSFSSTNLLLFYHPDQCKMHQILNFLGFQTTTRHFLLSFLLGMLTSVCLKAPFCPKWGVVESNYNSKYTQLLVTSLYWKKKTLKHFSYSYM